jgi:multicomponent Na+:H+ antiporter subunit B
VKHHLVLRVVSKLLIPFILLFALYVQFHGDYGPGGGFQAGVIFGAGFILYALIFGLDTARTVARPAVIRVLVAVGVLIYGGVGVASLLLGGNYLDYSVLAHEPAHGQHLGISLIEFGVGTTVAAVMITIFFAYAGRGRR